MQYKIKKLYIDFYNLKCKFCISDDTFTIKKSQILISEFCNSENL